MKLVSDFNIKSMFVDLLFFRRLITSLLVRILYWLALLILAWEFISLLLTIWSETGFMFKLYAAFGFVVMLFATRIVCEMFMMLLGIYSRLGEIRDQLSCNGCAKPMPAVTAGVSKPKPAVKAAGKAKSIGKATAKAKIKGRK